MPVRANSRSDCQAFLLLHHASLAWSFSAGGQLSFLHQRCRRNCPVSASTKTKWPGQSSRASLCVSPDGPRSSRETKTIPARPAGATYARPSLLSEHASQSCGRCGLRCAMIFEQVNNPDHRTSCFRCQFQGVNHEEARADST